MIGQAPLYLVPLLLFLILVNVTTQKLNYPSQKAENDSRPVFLKCGPQNLCAN